MNEQFLLVLFSFQRIPSGDTTANPLSPIGTGGLAEIFAIPYSTLGFIWLVCHSRTQIWPSCGYMCNFVLFPVLTEVFIFQSLHSLLLFLRTLKNMKLLRPGLFVVILIIFLLTVLLLNLAPRLCPYLWCVCFLGKHSNEYLM